MSFLFPSQNVFIMSAYLASSRFWLDKRPLILDAFCGAGGAAWGYYLAGFIPVGVDIAPQANYPFLFIQCDAIALLEQLVTDNAPFAAIHASPPCQRYTRLNRINKIGKSTVVYADLVVATRALLKSSGLPFVIENVAGAALDNPLELCGAMFEPLKVYRHRYFEIDERLMIIAPYHKAHKDKTPPSGAGISPKGFVSITAGGVKGLDKPADYKNGAMGIWFMTQRELTESIPPAYTAYIGRQLIQYTQSREVRHG